MDVEIFVDLYTDEIKILSIIEDNFNDIDVEYVSGLNGLEVVGTLIVPSIALLLQVTSFIKDIQKNKNSPEHSHTILKIKKIELHNNSKIIIIPSNATKEEIEEICKNLS